MCVPQHTIPLLFGMGVPRLWDRPCSPCVRSCNPFPSLPPLKLPPQSVPRVPNSGETFAWPMHIFSLTRHQYGTKRAVCGADLSWHGRRRMEEQGLLLASGLFLTTEMFIGGLGKARGSKKRRQNVWQRWKRGALQGILCGVDCRYMVDFLESCTIHCIQYAFVSAVTRPERTVTTQ